MDMYATDQPLNVVRNAQQKLIICMVGLPGSGKTYIAQKINRYLSWIGHRCQVFNQDAYRRMLFPNAGPDFFDPEVESNLKLREQAATAVLADISEFLTSGGHIAIYDGNNASQSRRQAVLDYFQSKGQTHQYAVLWIESVFDDLEQLKEQRRELLRSAPDYRRLASEKAQAEFDRKVSHYKKMYQSMQDRQLDWIRFVNMGAQVTSNRVSGYLPSKILFFMMHLRLNKQPMYFTRHGQSMYNTKGKLGGDSALSPHGETYSEALASYLAAEPPIKLLAQQEKPLLVWTSNLQRTNQTATPLKNHITQTGIQVEHQQWRSLNEIDSGWLDGYTYKQIEIQYPEEFKAREHDKLRYRYPQGESYQDVINRLERVIFELERIRGPVVVVGHQAILRCLYGYFMGYDLDKIPFIPIPLHTVIRLTPRAYEYDVAKAPLGLAPAHDTATNVPTSSTAKL